MWKDRLRGRQDGERKMVWCGRLRGGTEEAKSGQEREENNQWHILILRHMPVQIGNMDCIQYAGCPSPSPECLWNICSVCWKCVFMHGSVCMRAEPVGVTFWKWEPFWKTNFNYQNRQNQSGRHLHDKRAHRRTSTTSSLPLFLLLVSVTRHTKHGLFLYSTANSALHCLNAATTTQTRRHRTPQFEETASQKRMIYQTSKPPSEEKQTRSRSVFRIVVAVHSVAHKAELVKVTTVCEKSKSVTTVTQHY